MELILKLTHTYQWEKNDFQSDRLMALKYRLRKNAFSFSQELPHGANIDECKQEFRLFMHMQ